jgi:hypothetical protein
MTLSETSAFRALLLVAMIAGLPLQSVAESRKSTLDSVEAPHLNDAFMKGMVVSCPRAGQIWGSSAMTEALGQIGELGVEWIAIHPYARVYRDGTVGSRPADGVDYLERAVEIIRAAGMQIFWKPHLAYWGSFEWRGEIEFGTDEAAWRRFFDSYREFIVDQARFAQRQGVEIFAVGVEYEKTTYREEEWRRIIKAVREVYDGKLTYAANWDSLDRVPFWDALDWIGVHAYYPLSPEDNPSKEALWRGWDEPLRQLSSLSSTHRDMPIFFAEIGYSRSHSAAREPWLPHLEDDPEALRLRERLIEVALQRLEAQPFVRGVFWWKWIPGPDPWDRDFSMKDPEARRALASYWGQEPEGAAAKGRHVAAGSEE